MLAVVQTRMQRAPWWVWSLVTGGLFGLIRFVWTLIDSGSVGVALLSGMIGGLIFGLLFGPFAARAAKRQREAMGPHSDEQMTAARRAAWRGPVPEDSQVRAAAAGAARYQLEQYNRQRIWAPLLWVGFIALALWLAVTSSPWWLLSTAAFTGFLVFQLWMPRHLRRRLTLLQPPADVDEDLRAGG